MIFHELLGCPVTIILHAHIPLESLFQNVSHSTGGKAKTSPKISKLNQIKQIKLAAIP